MAGRKKKAKANGDGRPPGQRLLEEFGVSSSPSANSSSRLAPDNQTQAGQAREPLRSPLNSPAKALVETEKEGHRPSFVAIQPAQDIVATKRQSPHNSLQSKGECEPHRRIKELEDDTARLTKENHLLKEEVKSRAYECREAPNVVESMCCEQEKPKCQLDESKSQYEDKNKEMAGMQKEISKRGREVEILRRLLGAADPKSLSTLDRELLDSQEAGKLATLTNDKSDPDSELMSGTADSRELFPATTPSKKQPRPQAKFQQTKVTFGYASSSVAGRTRAQLKLKTKDPATAGAPPTKSLTTDVPETSKLPKRQPNLAQKIKQQSTQDRKARQDPDEGMRKGIDKEREERPKDGKPSSTGKSTESIQNSRKTEPVPQSAKGLESHHSFATNQTQRAARPNAIKVNGSCGSVNARPPSANSVPSSDTKNDDNNATSLVVKKSGLVMSGDQARARRFDRPETIEAAKPLTENQPRCQYCFRYFSNHQSRDNHEKSKHPNGRTPICNWNNSGCDKRISNPKDLSRHIRTNPDGLEFRRKPTMARASNRRKRVSSLQPLQGRFPRLEQKHRAIFTLLH